MSFESKAFSKANERVRPDPFFVSLEPHMLTERGLRLG